MTQARGRGAATSYVIGMARVSFRIVFGDSAAIGPGKVSLLERIDELGSISAAGRDLDMSYRRAWTLVDDLNAVFRRPVVRARPGGRRGGGAEVTPLGKQVVRDYRALEAVLLKRGRAQLASLESAARRSRAKAL